MKRLIVAIVMMLAGLVLASPAQAYPTMPQGIQGPFTVVKVVDGDTIHVDANGQPPQDPHDRPGHAGDGRSAQAGAVLWPGGFGAGQDHPGRPVGYLETDPSQDTIDKYSRTLAYLQTASGRLFNLDMIADGYAFEYTYDLPYRYQADFKAAEDDARTQESRAVVAGRLSGNETWGQSGPERKRKHSEEDDHRRHWRRAPQRRIAGGWGGQCRRVLQKLHRSMGRRSGTAPRRR